MNACHRLRLMEKAELFDAFCQGYVFGSSLYSMAPKDIDVLLVYNDRKNVWEIVVQLRRIGDLLEVEFKGLPVDIVALSDAELKETGFLELMGTRMRFR